MPLNHRAEHGKPTPGHISMVIEANSLLPGRQYAGGSVSLCPHQRGCHGESTGADCTCSLAKSIDGLPYTYATRARHGRNERCCTIDLPMPLGEEHLGQLDCPERGICRGASQKCLSMIGRNTINWLPATLAW